MNFIAALLSLFALGAAPVGSVTNVAVPVASSVVTQTVAPVVAPLDQASVTPRFDSSGVGVEAQNTAGPVQVAGKAWFDSSGFGVEPQVTVGPVQATVIKDVDTSGTGPTLNDIATVVGPGVNLALTILPLPSFSIGLPGLPTVLPATPSF
jgi:hypothetical protein